MKKVIYVDDFLNLLKVNNINLSDEVKNLFDMCPWADYLISNKATVDEKVECMTDFFRANIRDVLGYVVDHDTLEIYEAAMDSLFVDMWIYKPDNVEFYNYQLDDNTEDYSWFSKYEDAKNFVKEYLEAEAEDKKVNNND